MVKIVFLLLLCGLCGAVTVFPLWKFATSAPDAYTFTVIAIILGLAIFFIIQKIKKNGIRSVLTVISKIVVIGLGLSFIFLLVVNGKRLLSIPVLLAMIFLYGLLNFSNKNQRKELQNENSEN